MPDDADVIIVGAGPAGSALALLLARAGRDVLVLDRHTFPRAKPCGDCLSAATGRLLAELGVLQDVRRLPHAVLPGWRIFAPDGSSFSAGFDGGCTPSPPAARRRANAADAGGGALAVERAALDALLLAAAVAAGARVQQGTHVRQLLRSPGGDVTGVVTDRGTLRARLTVGADGLRSVVARRLGALRRPPRLRKLSLSMHIDATTADLRLGEMHTGAGLCAGLAPLRPDGSRANLTVVADTERFGRNAAADPRQLVRDTVAAMPGMRGRIPDAALADGRILASGPFDMPVRAVVFDGAALVGDAAGYFDPFTGQGVHHALLGAFMLAPVADDALRAGTCRAADLAPYARALAASRRGPRFVQHGIDRVLARPRLASFAIRRIRAAPPFAAALVAVTGDLAPAVSLLRPDVLSSLFRLSLGDSP